MLRGTWGLCAPSEEPEAPVGLCPGCGGEVYGGERLTLWEGVWVCPDCFARRVEDWLCLAPAEVACALGLAVRRAAPSQ